MKIVNLKEFLLLPNGTIFTKYEPCVFDGLFIKYDNANSNDFYYGTLTSDSAIDDENSHYIDILHNAVVHKTNFELDYDQLYRDGMFDTTQLFTVWSSDDIRYLVRILVNSI